MLRSWLPKVHSGACLTIALQTQLRPSRDVPNIQCSELDHDSKESITFFDDRLAYKMQLTGLMKGESILTIVTCATEAL